MTNPRSSGGSWRLPLAGALALAVTAAGGAAPAHAYPPLAAGAGTPPAPSAPVASHAVTLLTGDQVVLEVLAGGEHRVTVAARRAEDRTDVWFQTIDDGQQVYVVPSDAAPLVGEVLDRELFNVSKLAAAGHTDGVPVIAGYPAGLPRGAAETFRGGAAETFRGGAAVTEPARELPSIGALALTIDDTGDWWRSVAPAHPGAATGPAPLRTAGAPPRVWLDEQVSVSLADSVGQVGAPTAWDAGFDGTGVRVAVLDTGIDADHPDLAGKVVGAADFTDSGSVEDRHGHGTHVAGIIAGTGAASQGEYVGVAPGADLLNGKVLNDEGWGATSGIIAGMEWAVAQGADVVNMSLGGPAGDGTDPLSQAVNALTEAHDVLFAVAAGNSGPGDHTLDAPGVADAALTVGAVTKGDALADFSSRGPRWGDFAIKPDLTAPGAQIVAARAAGTALGTPAGEHYTSLSGTSMAAPHAAAAAAILLQAEPQLDPAGLKARLSAPAVPHPAYDPYQQGGGRIDIPAALAARVQVGSGPLNLGYFPYPHDGLAPVSAEVSYTNLTDESVTLELAVSARTRQGVVAGPQMLSVSPEVLTVPAGGQAQATVTVDATAGAYGLYGGYLTAHEPDGAPAASLPVGFHYEPERYDLTIVGIDADGRPAGGASNIAVLDVENMARFLRPGNRFTGGEIRLRVPPGVYSVVGAIATHDAHERDIQQTAFVGDPELTVAEDTTLVLDARAAVPVSVTVPQEQARPQGMVGFGFWRTAELPGPLIGMAWIGLHAGQQIAAQPMSGEITKGGFEFYHRWRLAEPEALLSVVDPVVQQLDPVLVRAPAVDGEQVVPLVDAGTGSAADFAGLDVAGAAVLTRRGAVPWIEQEEHAAAAGAVALIISNDVPGPMVGLLTEAGSIPTLSVTEAAGDELRALLAGGEVQVRLDGTAWSPYLYDVLLVEEGGIPEQLDYRPDPARFAPVTVDYHNDVPGHAMVESRHFSRPFHSSATYLHPPVVGAQQRTEYVIADVAAYHQVVYGEAPIEAPLYEQSYRTYEPGVSVATSFYRQVVRPALLPEVGLTRRTGDTLQLEVYEWVDDAGNHFPEIYGLAPYPGDTVVAQLYRDGELVAEADKPRGSFPMAAEPAQYRLDLSVTREADWWQRSTQTDTSWTFGSQRPAGEAVLPLLSIDYQLELDRWNTVPAPHERRGPPLVDFQVRQQLPGQPAVAGARWWISYDDGASWQARPVRQLGDGRFQVVLPHRPPQAGTGFASVRVEAWDADGNQVDQQVIRAWRH